MELINQSVVNKSFVEYAIIYRKKGIKMKTTVPHKKYNTNILKK